MKPSTPVLHSTRLLDQLRECLRYRHYSLGTSKNPRLLTNPAPANATITR